MSRPKPTVLLEHVNKTNYKSDQILNSEGIWAVFYDGQPINLKTQNMLVAYPGPKYKKVSFSNPGHAINLAKKLNIKLTEHGRPKNVLFSSLSNISHLYLPPPLLLPLLVLTRYQLAMPRVFKI